MTGWLKKLAKKPSRAAPITSMMAPLSRASIKAASVYATLPCAATAPTLAAVMREVTAAGPTAKVPLLPIKAYSTKGAMLAYKPACAGKPANSA